MVRDPVCNMQVDETKTPHKSVYQEQTFYFCSPSCKKAFDDDPDVYAAGDEVYAGK